MTYLQRTGLPPIQPGVLWRESSQCARVLWREGSQCVRTDTGRRLGKALLAAALLRVGFKLFGKYRRYQRRQRWNKVGRDVVVLHQFQRAVNMPSLSPFGLKLETFLRMADIKYVVDNEEPQDYKCNKCPWITINGEELSDTELIIDYLSKHFNMPLKEKLTATEHAVGRVVQVMLDEHTFFAVAYKRYILDRMTYFLKCLPRHLRLRVWFLYPIFFKLMKRHLYIQGMGRFSEEEMLFFLHRELRSVQDVLGEKPFLLADTPTTYDATVFAELTQVIYGCAPEVERYVRDNHAPLVRYHERMKDRYWQDWDQCRSE